MASPEIKLRLVLTSTAQTPEQIVAQAGIVPSESWRIGEVVHPRATNRHRENGCMVEVIDSALSSAAKLLTDAVRTQSATLTNLTSVDVELSCVVYVYDVMPELHLDPEFVAFAASIGAALDFDVYVLSDESGK